MSYPISSRVSQYRPEGGYGSVTKPAFVPHGLSVVMSAPAVFSWTCVADPARHKRAAEMLLPILQELSPHSYSSLLLRSNTSQWKAEDAGLVIADCLRELLSSWSVFVPNGLSAMGYVHDDVPRLVEGTLPQRRVLDISPRKVDAEDLHALFVHSMTLY